MQACARFDKILIVGDVLNGRYVYVDGMTGDPLFYFWIFKSFLTRIPYAKFHGILIVGYILNESKWILSFRCHCQLVEHAFDPYIRTPLTLLKGNFGKSKSYVNMKVHEHSSTSVINREALELHTKRNLQLQLVISTSSEPRPPPLWIWVITPCCGQCYWVAKELSGA